MSEEHIIGDELTTWLTVERIAGSDFTLLLFERMKDPITPMPEERIAEILEVGLYRLCNRYCAYLASVLAHDTGLSLLTAWRKGLPEWPMVHGALLDPIKGEVMDILGKRNVTCFREDLEDVVGPLSLKIVDPIHPGEFLPDLYDTLSIIGRGLPWIPYRDDDRPNIDEWGAAFTTLERISLSDPNTAEASAPSFR